MKNKGSFTTQNLVFIGIGIFIVLFIFSTTLYPGGSQNDLGSKGFDWVHNYWCNLMGETTLIGIKNPSRPFALAGLFTLCASLLLFFFRFANHLAPNEMWKNTIKVSGLLSMIFASLIFTLHHDLMSFLSSIMGIFVTVGLIYSLHQSAISFYKRSGLFCIILLLLNNYIYYSEYLLSALPLLQKLTLAFILIWIIGLNHVISNEGIPSNQEGHL